MKLRKISIRAITLTILLLGLLPDHVLATTVSVNLFDRTYLGDYDGDSIFSYAGSDPSFTLYSDWKDGQPDGSASIQYADGSSTQVSFTDGVVDGEIIRTEPDGSRASFSCISGIPYGLITYSDAEGSISGYDNYYQGCLLSQLCADAQEIPYHDLFRQSFYSAFPVQIHGKVKGIIDEQDSEFLVVEDDDGHFYVLNFFNASTDPYNQGVVPNFQHDDTITAYGYFQKVDVFDIAPSEKYYGIRRLAGESLDRWQRSRSADELIDQLDDALLHPSSSETTVSSKSTVVSPDRYAFRNSSLPFLLIFYAQSDTAPAPDRMDLQYSYDELLLYPYTYSGLDAVISGSVIQSSIDYSDKKVQFTLKEDVSEDLYLVEYPFKDDTALPVYGDTILVTGKYNGNAKVNTTTERDGTEVQAYILYPSIIASQVDISA